MMRRSIGVALMMACVFILSSCDDGGEDRLTREEFLEQGNEICSSGNQRVEEAAQEAFGDVPEGQQPSAEQLEEFFPIVISEIEGQLDDIGELSPPEDLEEDVDELLEMARTALEDLEDQGPEALLSQEDPFEEVNTLAEEIGLTECAQ